MSKPKGVATHTSIPLPSDEDYQAVVGAPFDPEKTLYVIKMLAGTGDMYAAAIGLIKAVFTAEGIDPKIRQMIILRSAKVLNVPYEWQANETLSRNNGLSEDEITAASNDGPVADVAPEYVLICRAVDEMASGATLTDPTLQALLDRFGATTTRKLVLILGWFSLLSLFLNGCRVPMETIDKIGSMRSPLG